MKNRYELSPDGKHAIIYIRCGGVERATIISADDLPRAQEVPNAWYGERRDWTMYVHTCFGRPRQYAYLHRFIMQPSEDNEIDHGDHDGMNNTRENLQEVTPEENRDNRREKCGDATAWRDYEKGCSSYVDPDVAFAELMELLDF